MNKLAILLILLTLTACPSERGRRQSTLVCHDAHGETFRRTADWWKFSNGAWHSGYDGPRYRPSADESCLAEYE